MESVTVRSDAAASQRLEVEAERQKAAARAEQCAGTRASCMQEYEVALPALHAAEGALRRLDKRDLNEMRGMRVPPPNVKVVIASVCVMLGEAPSVISTGGRSRRDYWTTGVRLLGERDLVARLASYDRDNIDPAVMKRIREEYLSLDMFLPQVVAHSSKAAEGLCAWVHAMSEYNRVDLLLRPKKAALEAAERELEAMMHELGLKKAALADASPDA